jgi:hypothetical protein
MSYTPFRVPDDEVEPHGGAEFIICLVRPPLTDGVLNRRSSRASDMKARLSIERTFEIPVDADLLVSFVRGGGVDAENECGELEQVSQPAYSTCWEASRKRKSGAHGCTH